MLNILHRLFFIPYINSRRNYCCYPILLLKKVGARRFSDLSQGSSWWMLEQELELCLSPKSEFWALFVEYPLFPAQPCIPTYWNLTLPVKPTFLGCLPQSLWPEMTLLSSSLTALWHWFCTALWLKCLSFNSSLFYWTSGRNVSSLCNAM